VSLVGTLVPQRDPNDDDDEERLHGNKSTERKD
jgi:hypothetical protein